MRGTYFCGWCLTSSTSMSMRELTTPPEPHKRPIGFVTPEDKGKKTSGARLKT